MESSSLADRTARQQYLERVHHAARLLDSSWPSTDPRTHPTNVSLHPRSSGGADILPSSVPAQWTPNAFLDWLKHSNIQLEAPSSQVVCIIENITPSWIEALGAAWDIPPEFFANHAMHPLKHPLWIGREVDSGPPSRFGTLHGVFEFHDLRAHEGRPTIVQSNFFPRHLIRDHKAVPQCSTRVSYCRVWDGLYLFLLDGPIHVSAGRKVSPSRARTTLRLPYSMNRGGMMLPQLFEKKSYRLLDSFQSFLTHLWHYGVLFQSSEAVRPQELLYTLSSSIWKTNLRFLDQDIKRISFEELRDPNADTNIRLHDRREDLEQLKDAVRETIAFSPEGLDAMVEQLCEERLRGWSGNRPIHMHRTMLDEAKELEKFLMDSFQLLMSSLSSRDSGIGLQQARRAMLVTWLAFIYVPLSFVTGIFGMNIRQINDSKLSIWYCFAALAVIGGVTLILVGVSYLVRQMRKAKSDGGR